MTVLVTGATGTVGSEVVAGLCARGVPVRALTRSPESASFPDGATPVAGDLLDIEAMREALTGVDGVFLLSAVAAEELTATLNTLDLIRDAGIRHIVYLSVIHADSFTDPSHFAAKAAAERMIADFRLPATILRPGYYMQNDAAERQRIVDHGVYAPPVGDGPLLAVDTRDLAEVAVSALLRRIESEGAAPPETLDVVAPEPLSGQGIARIWSEILDRPVHYGGGDLHASETQLARFVPGWMAHDLRLMMRRFQRDGMYAAPGTDERLHDLLGRPMRSYREFARETADSWNADTGAAGK